MSLFSKAARFARSPQGKKAMEKAKDFASKPETKEKIEQAREKLSGKDRQQAPAGSSEPSAPAEGGTPPVNAGVGQAGGDQAVGEQPAQGNPPQGPQSPA